MIQIIENTKTIIESLINEITHHLNVNNYDLGKIVKELNKENKA